MLEHSHPSLIRKLKKLLPPSNWQWIFPALRLDPLVWDSLCNFEQVFGIQDLSEIIQHSDDCTPAALALKALKYPRTPQELRLLPLIPVDPAHREEVEAAESIPIRSLKDAALLALNLRQKRHLTGSWNDWTSLLENVPTTALACLFGIIPDQLEFLQALLPSRVEDDDNKEAYQRIIRVILSNPAPFSVQIELMNLLLQSLSLQEQELFQQALLAVQPSLASRIPNSTIQFSPLPQVDQQPPKDIQGLLHKIKSFTKQLPLSLKIFDQRDPVLKTQQLTQSIQLTAQTQALMLTKLAILSEINSADLEADAQWQIALRLQPQSESLKALSILSKLSKQHNGSILDQGGFSDYPEPSTSLLKFAYRLLDEQQEFPITSSTKNELKTLAQNTLEETGTLALSDLFLSDQEIQEYLLVVLIQLFINQRFYALAQQAVSRLLKSKPNHPALLSLSAILYHLRGLHEQALDIFHLLEGIHPQDERVCRLLAESLAVNREWQSALEFWQNRPTPCLNSLYERITWARFSEQTSFAIKQCKSAIQASPQDGILLSFLAEIDHSLDVSQRIEFHHQATELVPSEPYVWLSYARTAQKYQDNEKALSILKAAEQTLPNNGFIQCALGELYLAMGQPSLALPHLQSAFTFAVEFQPLSFVLFPRQLFFDDGDLPEFLESFKLRFNVDWGSPAITFDQWYGNLIAKLSEALFQLGHRKEAKQILEEAFERYSSHTDLAHQLARLKMAEGKYEEAGHLLKEIVLGKTHNPQVAIDFARCALQIPSLATLDEIILTLQTVLEVQPEHFEALTLLAQALLKINQPGAALKLYDLIFRLPQAHEPAVHEQLAYEMSQAALKAGEYELALTTLLECDQQNPNTQRVLAETYLLLGLHQEAAQVAQVVHSLNPSNMTTLSWVANLFIRLAQSDSTHAPEFYAFAIEVLQQAVDIAPQRSDLLLSLAETLIEMGDRQQAKEILLRFVPGEGAERSPSETELVRAAQSLNKLGEQNAALACYKKSVTLLQACSPLDRSRINELLLILADIYRQQQCYVELKKTLRRAMDLSPNNLTLFFDYIATWMEVNKHRFPFSPEDPTIHPILNLFEHHLEQNPTEQQLSLLYGLFLRWTGNSTKAIAVLNQLTSDLTNTGDILNNTVRFVLLVTALTELSRIHRSLAERKLAEHWLGECLKLLETNFWGNKNDCIEFYCDWLEIAIPRGEDCQSLLLEICNKNPDHLRLIALMSLAKIYQADFRGAKILFETAIPTIAEVGTSSSSFPLAIAKLLDFSRQLETLYTFATVAQDLGQWNLACEFLNQALRLEPEGVRAHWERIKALVLRAEYQHLCKLLGMVTNAPGETALSEEAKRDFAVSAKHLQQSIDQPAGKLLPEESSLDEWIARGKIVFAIDRGERLDVSSENVSTETLVCYLLTASQDNLQKLIAIALQYPEDSLVKFNTALSMLVFQPQWATSLLESLAHQLENIPDTFSKKRGWILSRKHFAALIRAAYAQAILNSLASKSEKLASKRSAALEALDAALEYYPDEPNWHLLASHLASLDRSSHESIQKAIMHLEQAIQWRGNALDLHVKLAQLYLDIQKIDTAIQILENAAALDEKNSLIDYWLAQAYLKHNKLEVAATYAQTAIEKSPFEIDPILLRGEIALQMHDAATALQLAEQALEQPTEDARIWGLFARALHAAGKTDDALRVLEQTIPEKIEYIPLHLQRIEILYQWRGVEATLQEINGLLDIFPQAIPLLLRQAEILAELGEIEPAISAAQTALRQSHQSHPTASLSDHAHSHRFLGNLFYRNGNLDQAIYHLSEVIRLMPNEEAAYLTLGDIYLSRGENERALAAYHHCLKINAENSMAYFKSGVLYKELKDYLAAEQMLRQAARLEPNNLAIQRQLGAVVALNLIHTRRTKEKKTP